MVVVHVKALNCIGDLHAVVLYKVNIMTLCVCQICTIKSNLIYCNLLSSLFACVYVYCYHPNCWGALLLATDANSCTVIINIKVE